MGTQPAGGGKRGRRLEPPSRVQPGNVDRAHRRARGSRQTPLVTRGFVGVGRLGRSVDTARPTDLPPRSAQDPDRRELHKLRRPRSPEVGMQFPERPQYDGHCRRPRNAP